MKVIRGDLLRLTEQGHFDVLIHGCNCFCTMGAGIAKQIKSRYPEAWRADLDTFKGDRQKLGDFTSADVVRDRHAFTVVNAYTQYNWRGKGVKADYDAIASVFQSIAIRFAGLRIAYPKIGAGLAGGEWNTIESIINDALKGEQHTLVIWQPD